MNKEALLLEKRRYGLEEKITKEEEKLLKQGVPIQKIMGFIDFNGVRINVNHKVLIPRYETEEVVNKALEFINEDSIVLDLCCGSGFIGLSIKKKTNAHVTLSDVDDEAIKQTAENAEINNLDVKVIKSDLFEQINDKYDVIISNPPYIPSDNKLDESVINHEPLHALFAGKDGNKFYKKIIDKADQYLKPGGYLVLEISEDNIDFIKSKKFKILKDINNKYRIAYKKY